MNEKETSLSLPALLTIDNPIARICAKWMMDHDLSNHIESIILITSTYVQRIQMTGNKEQKGFTIWFSRERWDKKPYYHGKIMTWKICRKWKKLTIQEYKTQIKTKRISLNNCLTTFLYILHRANIIHLEEEL